MLKQFEKQLQLRKQHMKLRPGQPFKNDEKPEKDLKYLIDNPPKWNAKTNKYVNNFSGRVKEASIKNFQLIPEVIGK